METRKIASLILIIGGFLTSLFIGIEFSSKENTLLYNLIFTKRFSLIDIALGRSEENTFKSQLISIFLYLIFLILIFRDTSKSYLIYIFAILLLIMIIFEIYCIYLVHSNKYPGQHLRLSIVIFLLGISLLRKDNDI